MNEAEYDWSGLAAVHGAAKNGLRSILTDARPVIVPRIGMVWLTYRPASWVHLKCPIKGCDTRFGSRFGSLVTRSEETSTTARNRALASDEVALEERYKKAWMAPAEFALDMARHAGLIPLLFVLKLVRFDTDHVMLWSRGKR